MVSGVEGLFVGDWITHGLDRYVYAVAARQIPNFFNRIDRRGIYCVCGAKLFSPCKFAVVQIDSDDGVGT